MGEKSRGNWQVNITLCKKCGYIKCQCGKEAGNNAEMQENRVQENKFFDIQKRDNMQRDKQKGKSKI